MDFPPYSSSNKVNKITYRHILTERVLLQLIFLDNNKQTSKNFLNLISFHNLQKLANSLLSFSIKVFCLDIYSVFFWKYFQLVVYI